MSVWSANLSRLILVFVFIFSQSLANGEAPAAEESPASEQPEIANDAAHDAVDGANEDASSASQSAETPEPTPEFVEPLGHLAARTGAGSTPTPTPTPGRRRGSEI